VAVVPGKVDQRRKWDPGYGDRILDRYLGLTRQAMAQRPDLIVWPETAVPFAFEQSAGRRGKKVPGSVIAYAPDADAEAQVVQTYFPSLETRQVKGLPDGVAVFVDGSYEPVPVGGGGGAPPDCPTPEV
jgi:hypothetical protein